MTCAVVCFTQALIKSVCEARHNSKTRSDPASDPGAPERTSRQAGPNEPGRQYHRIASKGGTIRWVPEELLCQRGSVGGHDIAYVASST